MRFTTTTIALLLCAFNNDGIVSSFVIPTTAKPKFATRTVTLQMSESSDDTSAPPPKKKLTEADVLARAKARSDAAAAGAVEEEDEPPPKIFEDDILDDMQASLLTLEKRVKEGPGSIEAKEVLEFEAAVDRIVEEMNAKIAEEASGGGGAASSSSSAVASTPLLQTPSVPQPTASSMSFESFQPTSASPQPLQSELPPQQEESKEVVMEEDGPAYDGKGGMGMASGTRNTYVIEGMDEMSPEEYRAALQKSVSDRQERRRVEGKGIVGNRAAHQYLDTLGWGGASSNLGKGAAAEED